MKAVVYVTLKTGILDAQGSTIKNSLHSIGFGNVSDVRQGKYFELNLKADNEESARQEIESICTQVLANPVIEDFKYDIQAE